MSNTNYVSMVVCWKQQRRLVHVKSNHDFDTIEKAVIDIYDLKQWNHFHEYQIQYFDPIYKTFIDLSSETIERFQTVVQTLLLRNETTKGNKIWRLRIIPKAIGTIRTINVDKTVRDTSTIDAYQSDEQKSINTPNDDIISSPHSMTDIEDVHEVGSSQIVHNVQQIINSNNPLNLHFQNDIADRQRKQYESDISRKKTPNCSFLGGVFLRVSNPNRTVRYPKLQFQIPENKLRSSWCLYLYILTECDSNDNYYLHASKGIYDGLTMAKDKFGPIPNSTLVNPHKIELSEADIKQGEYELRLRVCSIRNLTAHKHEKLRRLPELTRFMIYEDDDLQSEFTTTSLNFDHEKYHLGCILVCDYRVQDRCISHLAIDDHKRKPN